MELRPNKKRKVNKGVHHKKGERGGKRYSHGKNKPWEKKVKGKVAATMKNQKKETEKLAKLASLVSAVQPAAASSNVSTINTDTAAVKINEILKRRRGIP